MYKKSTVMVQRNRLKRLDQQHEELETRQNVERLAENLNPPKRCFFQLSGHKESFRAGNRPNTILKKLTGNEEQCLSELVRDQLAPFVPRLYGKLEQSNGDYYLEMQNLLTNFDQPSIMDVKMGYRTYREEDLYNAMREDNKLRPDMYEKMVEINENEPTDEERKLGAITKPRYMMWRETVSSTASLGFRIEAMRLCDGTIDKNFKTLKEEEQIAKAFVRYAKNPQIRLKYLRRLYDLRRVLQESKFFHRHELIGGSLLFVHDNNQASVWLIDFAKTHALPEHVKVTHRNKWELGNREDGYLAGVDNLIRVFESITVVDEANSLADRAANGFCTKRATSNNAIRISVQKVS